MEENYEENHEEAEDYGEERPGWFKRNTPTFMVSMALHALILLFISLIPVQETPEDKNTVIITDIVVVEDVEEPPEIETIDPIDEPVEVVVEETTEEEVVEEEVVLEEDLQESEDITEDILHEIVSELPPSEAPPIMGLASLGPTGGSGGMPTGSGLGNRKGKGKDKALRRYRVGSKEINAVEKALKWLAHHQSKDGSWDVEKYEGKSNHHAQEAVTAAALLAFLGGGHSERIGEYKKTVSSGIRYLNNRVSEKKNNPHFGKNYGSALILMALSEAEIFGSSSSTRMNANKIAQMFIEQYAGQGWHYNGGGGDFSVSGWIGLALKSTKSAELESMQTDEAKKMFVDFTKWVDTVATTKEGFGCYNNGGRKTPHMTWVGQFMHKALDLPSTSDFMTNSEKNSINWIKSGQWVGTENVGSVYGIYYGTIASFQLQGEQWRAWDASMRRTLLPSQRQGKVEDLGGSWDPTKCHTGRDGGRVLTTALFALCLEVYYRYELMN
jgi:hypothetical protein